MQTKGGKTMAYKRKLNDKYFSLIPPKPKVLRAKEEGTGTEVIVAMTDQEAQKCLADKYKLKEQRIKYVEEARQIREQIYNLTLLMNAKEEKLDIYIKERLLKK